MQPIFNEQIKMWSDLGYPLPIEEGTYWYDNHFICAFDMGGVRHKLYRYKVFDDLSIEIKPYEKCKDEVVFETWNQTVSRMSEEINEKSSHAMSVICKAIQDYPKHKKVVFTSTGKDSMVVLDLVKHILPDIGVYFNNTSLDTGDTYKMAKQHGDWTIINPEIGFYQYVKQARFIPTRFSRGCCTVFKEGKSIEYFDSEPQMLFFMGVRNDESAQRADRQDISHNPKWRDRDWFSCLPIRTWSEFDVWLYILKHKLEINPKYRKGYTRVGCSVACPYYTKYTWVLDKYWYRMAYDRWREILHKDFVQEQRWAKLNCTVAEYVKDGWNGGLYRPEPTEEVVEEFMIYKGLTDYNVALQYFNKTCECCGRNVRQNEVLAMNLKLLGRNTSKIYCKKHLKEILGMSNEEWDSAVTDFTRQGCALF